HDANGWTPATTVDHNEVLGSCSSCHDGTIASGKGNNHILSSDLCEACHDPSGWVPVITVDHAEVNGTCESSGCHSSLPGGHIDSSLVCDACHDVGGWVPPFTVDHDQVNGSCSSCHDGSVATGKPGDHCSTVDECDVCHSVAGWTAGVLPCGSPPEADPGGPYSEIVNTLVQFDGSNSFDPDGDTITDYQWDFGDGSTGSGVAPTHTYSIVGTYTVRLVVVANGDSSSSTSTSVDVVGNPPIADAGGSYSGTIMGPGGSVTITFDGSLSSDPDGDPITSYQWDFADGSTGTGAIVSHTYTAPCLYTVTLTVTAAGQSGQASTTATVIQMGGGAGGPGGPALPTCP
ncbi:MAG: PKD domain-containing protein, partial [Gammaproteobacteria bacterium]